MLDTNESVIANLPGFLTWNKGNDLIRASCEIYVGYAYRQLRTWSEFAGSDIYETVLKLPKSNQQRLLLAPSLFHLIQSKTEPDGEEIEALKEFVRMEQYLCAQSTEAPQFSWAALGDFYLPPVSEADSASHTQPSRTWGAGHSYQAPILSGIVLDAYSPAPNNSYPNYYGEVGLHTPQEMDTSKRRLEESLAEIKSVSDAAGAGVDAAIQVISLVCAPTLTAGTHSFSTRSTIGKMGLVNLHSELWATHKISNAIIHESIHSLIYKLQLKLVNALYTDEEAAERIPAVSPWSGRTLLLHSVVHACFVWFGLWSFWSMCSVEDEGTAALKEKARRGFMAGSLQSGLSSEAYECIQPAARLAIDEMFDQVTSSSSNH